MTIENATIRLNDAQVMQAQWAEALGVGGKPSEALVRATEEFHELAELLFKCQTPEDFDHLSRKDPDFQRRIKEETADTLVVILNVCTAMGFDAENLFLERLQRNHLKYPPMRLMVGCRIRV